MIHTDDIKPSEIVPGSASTSGTEQVKQLRLHLHGSLYALERGESNILLPKETIVCTDSSQSYANIADRYIHQFVDHSVKYVLGKVHVAPFHLQRYLDEEIWRFNFRRLNDGRRFNAVMRGVVGRRITYRQLCAIGDCGFMGIE